MGSTKIEWCEGSLFHSRKLYTSIKHRQWVKPFLVKPIEYISVFLRAIAGYTTRDNVARCSLSPLDNRDDMIPGSSYASAIYTQAARIFRQNLLSFWGDASDTPPMFISMALSLFPIFCIGSIASSGISILAGLATCSPYLVYREPLLTTTAPNQSLLPHFPSGSLAWFCGVVPITVIALCSKAVATRPVCGKFFGSLPSLTFPAPLQALGQLSLVAFKRQAKSACSYFHNAYLTSHYLLVFLSPLYSTSERS